MKKKKEKEKILAKLTVEEKNSIIQASELIGHRELEVELMKRGLNDLWKSIGNKYNLPEKFSFDKSTGEILNG